MLFRSTEPAVTAVNIDGLLREGSVIGETAMACPDCGSSTGDLRFVTSVETHGLDCGPYEVFNEEFVVCCGCGGRYDIRDWGKRARVEASDLHSIETY